MELTVHCPACGGRTNIEPGDAERLDLVVCPYCQREIPLQHDAEVEPRTPGLADSGGSRNA